jgi:hypothetical protein
MQQHGVMAIGYELLGWKENSLCNIRSDEGVKLQASSGVQSTPRVVQREKSKEALAEGTHLHLNHSRSEGAIKNLR